MGVAYLQSWCALRRNACLSQCTTGVNWLHLTVHRECLSRAVTHVCVITAIFSRSVYCYEGYVGGE